VNSKTGHTKNYLSYLLRLWQEEHDGQAVWRASLESTHDGHPVGFATLPRLFAFLNEKTESDEKQWGREDDQIDASDVAGNPGG
jgi:hypothetical protein